MAVRLGESSVTILLDLWKCYEIIAPEVVMGEVCALGYPTRLAWMALMIYGAPGVIKAFGSISKQTREPLRCVRMQPHCFWSLCIVL